MKLSTAFILTALAAAPVMAEPNGAASSGATPVSEFERYNVLSERNIFLRDRTRPRAPTSRPVPSTRPVEAAPDTPERRYVLRGVVLEDGEWRAYFENIRTSEGLRVQPGDAIGNGHVAQIAIDSVGYAAADGALTWIDVGQNLSGIRDTSAPTASAGATVSAAPTTGPSSAPVDAKLSEIEERMKQRNRGRKKDQ